MASPSANPNDIRWIDVITVEPADAHDALGSYVTWYPREATLRRNAALRTFELLAYLDPTARVRLWTAAIVYAFDDETITSYVASTFIEDGIEGAPDKDTHPIPFADSNPYKASFPAIS